MKARELEVCQIQHWYPRFSDISFKTIIHPLPEAFVSYLLEDGLFLPRCSADALPARIKPSLLDDDYQRWDEEEDEEEGYSTSESPSFPEFEAEVLASIQKLGGAVFPKLNWSAPKDSAWISPIGSLKCTNFGEIALLLKASDNLVHDLLHSFDSCEDRGSRDRPDIFVLALRKWHSLHPEMEFRCFVRNGLLVGISQREVTGFYPAVAEIADTLEESIFRFFSEHLCEKFELEDYTFDCYVTRSGLVKLMDFNPWGAFTLPLLFSWEDLENHYRKFSMALAHIEASEREHVQLDSELSMVEHEVEQIKLDGGMVENIKEGRGMVQSEDSRRFDAENDVEKKSFIELESCSRILNVLGSEQSLISKGASILPASTKALINLMLRKQNLKAQFRIVKSERHVQPNLRMGGGVPYDYVNTGPGSAWDEFLRKAGEELQQQVKDCAAGG